MLDFVWGDLLMTHMMLLIERKYDFDKYISIDES